MLARLSCAGAGRVCCQRRRGGSRLLCVSSSTGVSWSKNLASKSCVEDFGAVLGNKDLGEDIVGHLSGRADWGGASYD